MIQDDFLQNKLEERGKKCCSTPTVCYNSTWKCVNTLYIDEIEYYMT